MTTSESRDYFSVREAAELLGISRSTIWRWIGEERLRAYRFGRRTVRIRREDLIAAARPAFRPERGPSGEGEAVLDPDVDEMHALMMHTRPRDDEPNHGFTVVTSRHEFTSVYDPEAVRRALHAVAGTMSQRDADQLIADIYRWREDGSRPFDAPSPSAPPDAAGGADEVPA